MVEPRVTDRRLVKQGAAVGVDAYGEQGSQCLPLVPPESFGVLRNGDGVEVDDGVYQLGVGLLLVLQAKPLPQGTDIVAEMGHAGGLYAGEDDPGPRQCLARDGALHRGADGGTGYVQQRVYGDRR